MTLSKKYLYESNVLKDRYLDNIIDYKDYSAFLAILSKNELNNAWFFYSSERIEEEIWSFEIEQWESIKAIKQQREWDILENQRRQKEEEEKQRREEEERKREEAFTPEQKLFQKRENFYKNDVPELLRVYKKESKKYRNWHNGFQWSIIFFSTVVTSVTSINVFSDTFDYSFAFKVAAAVCSFLATALTGIAAFAKHRERSVNLQKVADDIENESDALKLGTHLYLGKPVEEAIGIYADRVVKRVKEYKDQQQLLEQPSETKQAVTNTSA